jgi:tetratricopeptide repeat protein/PEGA domain-containing protein
MAEIRTAPNLSALLALVLALLAPSTSQAQAAVAPAEASRHFERGYLLAQQGSLEEAISEFNQAYALQPHPSVLYNLGQAYAASGRAVEAVETLSRFLEQAPAGDRERRSQAAALMEYQTQRIGLLSLTVSPEDATISIDGVALGHAPLAGPIQLVAGHHALVLARPGFETRIESLQIVGKRPLGLALVLQPVKPPPGRSADADMSATRQRALESLRDDWQQRTRLQRTSAIIAGGVALASLTAAGALYLSNQKGYDDWNHDSRAFATRLQHVPGPSGNELDSLLARENTLRNRDALALGLAIFGGVLGTTSLALWLTVPRADSNHFTLQLGSSPWLGYSGSF